MHGGGVYAPPSEVYYVLPQQDGSSRVVMPSEPPAPPVVAPAPKDLIWAVVISFAACLTLALVILYAPTSVAPVDVFLKLGACNRTAPEVVQYLTAFCAAN